MIKQLKRVYSYLVYLSRKRKTKVFDFKMYLDKDDCCQLSYYHVCDKIITNYLIHQWLNILCIPKVNKND